MFPNLHFDYHQPDSAYVQLVYHTHTERDGTFISAAATEWELAIATYQGVTTLALRGPETRATQAEYPADAEFMGIIFKVGTFMPDFPAQMIMNRRDLILPEAGARSFWLCGAAWEIPTFDNVDIFINRLVRQGLLAREPLVEDTLQGRLKNLSVRSMQRRFLRATGLTHGTLIQIERARHALKLLQQGVSILDTVEQAGYSDQPHLTRSLKHLLGQTPAQILDSIHNE